MAKKVAGKKPKRFVAVADLHAHPWAAFAKGDGINNSRLVRTREVLRASLLRAREDEIPWLFAGDLVHTAGYSLNVVLAALSADLAEFDDVLKVAVWGNHDARGTGGKITLEQTVFASLARTIPNLVVLDPSTEPLWEAPSGLTVCGAGYQPKENLLDLSFDKADVGMFHQTVRGSHTPGGFELPEGVPAEALLNVCRMAVVGHIHHPQEGKSPKGQAVLIPGSPEHHSFGDFGDHGWWVITLPASKKTDPTAEFISGGSPEFRTVDHPRDVQDDGHFYSVKVMGAGETLPDHARAIAPSPTTVSERGLLKGASEVEHVLQAWMREAPPPEGLDPTECLSTGKTLLAAQDPARLRSARLRRLRLQNFCSYEDQELEIKDGIWLVIGQGRDYPSNGAGKSTLVGEALHWVLFGRNTKGLSADEVVRWGESGCSVEADVEEQDGSLLRIVRSKGSSSTLTVEQDGEPWEATGVAEMTAKLSARLGLTPEIHQALGYFSQEKLLLFSSATDGERKDLMADLIGLTAYQEASAAAGSKEAVAAREHASALSRVETLTEQQDDEQTRSADVRERSTEWERNTADAVAQLEATSRRVEAESPLAELRERLSAVLARADRVFQSGRKRDEAKLPSLVTQKEAQWAAASRTALTRLEADQKKLREQLRTAGFPSSDSAKAAVTSIRYAEDAVLRADDQLRDARSRLTAASNHLAGTQSEGTILARTVEATAREFQQAQKSLGEGVCPTCGQEVTESHRAKCLGPIDAKVAQAVAAKQESEQVLLEARRTAEDAQHVVRDAETKLTTQQNLFRQLRIGEDLLGQLANLDAERDRVIQQQLHMTSAAEEQAASEIARLVEKREGVVQARVKRAERFVVTSENQWTKDLDLLRARVLLLRTARNPYSQELSGIESRLASLTAKTEEAGGQAHQLALREATLGYWKRGFGKQGIQSLLVEEVATLFNAVRGEIFPVLTQGVYDVQFSTLSRTKGGELRERTEFLVFQHGEQIPYGTLSGGQRRRVDVGVMLTLVLAVSRWMGVPGVLGVLTLDEVFGFLDPSGAEGLLDALRQVQEQVPTIYPITHDTHLQSLFPDVLRVVQDEHGVSRVEE